MELMVNVLKSVDDFDGLVGWLNLGDEAHSIKGNCVFESKTVECRYRRLIEAYCREKGLHETLQDLADVLERDMGRKRQSDALLKLIRK